MTDGFITYRNVQKVETGITYHKDETLEFYIDTSCCFLLCYGYLSNWKNTKLVYVNKDYEGYKIRSINLKIEEDWIIEPTISFSDQTLIFKQMYEDGSSVQVIKLS